MCLRLKPPIIPASPTSPRLFSHHRTARSISGGETSEESSLEGEHDLQFWSLNVATVNSINKNGETFFLLFLIKIFVFSYLVYVINACLTFFYSVIFSFLWVSSPFGSLHRGLTRLRAHPSHSNAGLVAATISPCAADRGRVSTIGFVR